MNVRNKCNIKMMSLISSAACGPVLIFFYPSVSYAKPKIFTPNICEISANRCPQNRQKTTKQVILNMSKNTFETNSIS